MAGEYEKLKLLGSGSYGKAWLVNCVSKKKQAVLKEIRLDSLSDKEIGQTLVEAKVLAKCRHVNIISYCEAFQSSCCLHIVMEYADNGDMQKKILEQRGIHFNSEIILDWFIQICFALRYLHSENILHRDLKPQNLFLTSDGIVKVGDFGIARILQDTADHAITAIGTPYYLSPEICQRKLYNYKSDMWSAGCVLYELCCLRVPFQAPNLPLLVFKILEGAYDPVPCHYGAVLEDLVTVLLKTDPQQRPSAEQVLSVPALQPQVKVTYNRCLRHKQQHHRQRLASRDSVSPAVINQQKVEKSLICHQTFTVRSPLVRRLSVATPKLTAAIKRQRSVHSAEPVAISKKRRKSTKPPVLNLQDAFLSICPSCNGDVDQHHPSGRQCKDTSQTASLCTQDNDSCSYDSDIGTVPDKESEDFSDSDDVFVDREAIPKGDIPDTDHISPKDANATDTGHVPQKGPYSVCNKLEGSENVSSPSCPETHTHTRKRLKVESHHDTKSEILMKKEDQNRELYFHISKRQQSVNSDTYTVMGNDAKETPVCRNCGNGKPSQHCLHKALYTATAQSYKNKSAAQCCLSRFLIAHLGSNLSLHLCCLVNAALHDSEDYAKLETNLNEEHKKYLPVIFHLLSWSEEMVTLR